MKRIVLFVEGEGDLRQLKNRSFQRLENAMTQLLNAIATGQHVATPIAIETQEFAVL